jgi:hypothetical protein
MGGLPSRRLATRRVLAVPEVAQARAGASYGIVCSVSSCAAAAAASTVYLGSRRGGVRRAKEIPPIVPARLGVAPCEQSRPHQPELASSSLKLSSVGIDSLKAEREYCARREVLTWQAAEPSQAELRNIGDHVAVGFFSSEEFLQPSESTDDTGAVAVEMRRQIARAIGEERRRMRRGEKTNSISDSISFFSCRGSGRNLQPLFNAFRRSTRCESDVSLTLKRAALMLLQSTG